MSPPSRSLVLLTTLALVTSGCLSLGGDDLEGQDLLVTETRVVSSVDATPLAHAQATAVGPAGTVLATLNANATGVLHHAALPGGTAEVVVTAEGHASWRGAPADLGAVLTLDLLEEALPPDATDPVLRFLEPVLLGGTYLAGEESSCMVTNCGGSEPTVEVAGDGTIYVSGVCCVGASPPIWYSTDGGLTYEVLEGDLLRESYGIEGDFSIDDAGNLYFTDISVASAFISSWDRDQEHRHTVPLGPFRPIVDRPWTRAGAEDQVWFLYNTGATTELYESTDGGITWTHLRSFEGSLGAIGQGPQRDHLWVTVRGTLHESTDGGATWIDGEVVPTPSEEGGTFQAYWVPVVDEAGNLWVVYDWRVEGEDAYHVYAAHRSPDGTWSDAIQVSPNEGTHHLPWAATGREGSLVVAWYGTPDDAAHPNEVDGEARWFVNAAVTLDGLNATPSWQRARADPLPVHEGPMDRKLLDFLQVEVAPDGAIHLAYAEDRGDRPDELTHVVRSTVGLQLQPQVYLNGP